MNCDRKKLPRHEPEIVAAGARNYARGDDDKVATTSIKKLMFDGVEITSRYDKADELEEIREIANALSRQRRTNIGSIVCDGQHANYIVKLRRWNEIEAKLIASDLAKAAYRLRGGHSGISVAADNGSFFGDDKRVVHIDADWGSEEEG
jgi:nanoRNase/pAp phosphatase (c-di-AMP/oligoRNAs hydrolase)